MNALEFLKKESTRSSQLQKICEIYEGGVRQMSNQIKTILRYEARDAEGGIDAPLIKKNSIYENEEQSEIKTRSESKLDIRDKKWKLKATELELETNARREENERIFAKLEKIKENAEQTQAQLVVLNDEVRDLRKNVAEGKEALNATLNEQKKLEIAEASHTEVIKGLRQQLEKKITLIKEIENDRNCLQERFIQEKSQSAEKMNELNMIQQELNAKMDKLVEDEQFLMKRSLTFKTEVAKTKVKMPTLAPTIEESKIQLSSSDVPSKPSKIVQKMHKNEIYCISQSLNGSIVATCGGDNVLKLYDPFSQTTVGTIQSTRDDTLFLHAAFAPFSDLLVTALTDKTLQIYSYSTCKLKSNLQGHNDRVNVVSFTSEKEKVISGSADRTMKIWDITKSTSIKTVICGSIVRSVDYFQSEPHIITGHNDGSVRLYTSRDTSNTKPIQQFQSLFDGGITSVKLSSCQNYVLCSSADGYAVKCIDLRVGKVFKSFENNQYFNNHEFNKCCFGPDDKYVIAGCSDGSIFIWNFANGSKKSIIKSPSHQGVIVAVDFHNITGNLYSGDSRGNFVVWN